MTLARRRNSPETRRELRRHVHLILAESKAGALIEEDRQLIQHICESLAKKLSDTR